ncbi:hypothetical protein Q5M85_03135 [Paraclostridium bifermentans]|nr:hypothetical protein [Paraclostridium bifermentans]
MVAMGSLAVTMVEVICLAQC